MQGARSPWRLKIFTWRLNFYGFLSPYLQKKKYMLAPELFLVLSTPDYNRNEAAGITDSAGR
jgi:hypothetical protein